MSRARRIAVNTVWLVFSQILPFVASLFVVGYVARGLGPGGFGLLETALALATICSPIVFAGIQIILVRDIVRRPEEGPRAVGDALMLRLLLLLPYALLVFLISPAVIPREMVLLSIGTMFLVMYAQSWTIAFEASERMQYIAISNMVTSVLGMVLSVLAVAFGLGGMGVLGARFAGQLGAFLFVAIAVPIVLYRPKIVVDLRRWLTILRKGVPLALPYLLGLVLLEVDKWMLIQIHGPDEAGEYATVTVLAYKFDMVVISFQIAVVPALVATWQEGREQYRRLLGGALRFSLLLGLPVAIGTGFIARDIMGLIFGEQFLAASPTLALITWFVPLQFVNRILAASLGATDREKWVALSMVLAVAVNVALNLLLIPSMGHYGAAVATVGAEAFLVVVNLVIQRRDAIGLLGNMKLPQVLLSAALLFGLCYLLREQHGLVIFCAAVAAYPAIVLGTRSVVRADVRELLRR